MKRLIGRMMVLQERANERVYINRECELQITLRTPPHSGLKAGSRFFETTPVRGGLVEPGDGVQIFQSGQLSTTTTGILFSSRDTEKLLPYVSTRSSAMTKGRDSDSPSTSSSSRSSMLSLSTTWLFHPEPHLVSRTRTTAPSSSSSRISRSLAAASSVTLIFSIGVLSWYGARRANSLAPWIPSY